LVALTDHRAQEINRGTAIGLQGIEESKDEDLAN